MRDQRIAAGVSQKDLAKKLGVDQGRISNWESSGMWAPSLDTIAKIAIELGCTIDYLCGLTDNPKSGEILLADEAHWLGVYRTRKDEVAAATVEEEVAKLPDVIRDDILRIIARLQQGLSSITQKKH